jgi:hypothetical protein
MKPGAPWCTQSVQFYGAVPKIPEVKSCVSRYKWMCLKNGTANVNNVRISKRVMQCMLEQADSWQAARQARGM